METTTNNSASVTTAGKVKITTYIIAIVLIIAAFFGGKAYGSSHSTASATTTMSGRYGRAGMAGMGGNFAGRTGAAGGATIGQVVSKDATSITVSLTAGGSKIILYSPTTVIAKSTTGTIDDVTVGSTITATGTANSDGSLTATEIQIRPAGEKMPMTGTVAPTAPMAQ